MASTKRKIPIDGHVHFHTMARVGATLDAAVTNFSSLGTRPGDLLGALLLTQTGREHVFEELRNTPSLGGWTFEPAATEPVTVLASRNNARIAVVCGRQVRAANGLEVVALGTLETFPDGLPFEEAIALVRQSGAMTVLPWGFGKWLGARGAQVERMLASMQPDEILVGDNGSRLSWAGMPLLLRSAQARGFRMLPGTDPFPFANGHRRVGQFGFMVEGELGTDKPWRDIRAIVEQRRESPQPYGRATGPLRFVFNQLGIQLYSRAVKSNAG